MFRFLLLLSVITLAACGYSPMYGQQGTRDYGQEDFLAYTEIANIPNREGQMLRNMLIDRFYRSGRPVNPAYRLEVANLKENRSDLDITKDSDATRGQLKIEADLLLADKVTGEILINRRIRSIASYNILGSEFTNRVSEENTRQNVLTDMARQIELQTSLYFKRESEKLQ